MGYGFPALLGAACNSNRELFLYEGDGSAMMNLQELQTLKTNNNKLIQKNIAITLQKLTISSKIKLTVDVDPINFA